MINNWISINKKSNVFDHLKPNNHSNNSKFEKVRLQEKKPNHFQSIIVNENLRQISGKFCSKRKLSSLLLTFEVSVVSKYVNKKR